MPRIIGLAGSTRKRSLNRALLRACVALAPEDLEIEIESIEAIPLYDGDREEAEGLPQVVLDLQEKIGAADGLLLVTPEYNHGVPGRFKNAIDWLSRKNASSTFHGKPVGIMGATPGRGGTHDAQAAWQTTFRALKLVPFHGVGVYVQGAKSVFDDDLELVDQGLEDLLKTYLKEFSAFIRRIEQ